MSVPTPIKIWLQAARLRTLPLSFSGIIAGTALSMQQGHFNALIFILSLWCTLLFQVISNFANDYGDGIKGTDNEGRIGPKRVLQSGLLSPAQLKNGIVCLSLVAVVSVLALLSVAFGMENWPYFLLFFGLGILSIWAAIKYTVGSGAYGYRGLGDLFVFVFFGLLSVLGSKFLYAFSLIPTDIFAAFVVGSLSVAVLNLNNLRDHINDKKSNKNTLVVQYGYAWGKKYHMVLVSLALVSSVVASYFSSGSFTVYLPLLIFIVLPLHVVKVLSAEAPQKLDPELKKVALTTFVWSVLFLIFSNNLL